MSRRLSYPGFRLSQGCLVGSVTRKPCSPISSGRASPVLITIPSSWSARAAWIYFTKSISMAFPRLSTNSWSRWVSCAICLFPACSRLHNSARPFSFRRNTRRPSSSVVGGRTERLADRAPRYGGRAILSSVTGASGELLNYNSLLRAPALSICSIVGSSFTPSMLRSPQMIAEGEGAPPSYSSVPPPPPSRREDSLI